VASPFDHNAGVGTVRGAFEQPADQLEVNRIDLTQQAPALSGIKLVPPADHVLLVMPAKSFVEFGGKIVNHNTL
jgi:hypothetical protein